MHSCICRVRSFHRCDEGVVAPLFGLMILVIMIISGIAVDAKNGNQLRETFQKIAKELNGLRISS